MKFRPLYDKILVKRSAAEEKTSGGLFIPDSVKEKPIHGTVLAVGDGRILETGELKPLLVKEGDKVLFASKYAGTEIEDEGEKLLVLSESDLLGRFAS